MACALPFDLIRLGSIYVPLIFKCFFSTKLYLWSPFLLFTHALQIQQTDHVTEVGMSELRGMDIVGTSI